MIKRDENQLPSRSVRMLLVFLNKLLSQITQIFIAFFITPLILTTLGTDIFGAWKIINSSCEFLTLGNFKPLGLLRLTLAKEIGHDNDLKKQQQIGAAFNVLILTLPLLLVLSALLFHYRRDFIPVSAAISGQVDLALIVAMLVVIITPFMSFFDSIVSGLNLEYKRFGMSSVAKLTVAILTYYVVVKGATLPWVIGISSLSIFIPAVVSIFIIIRDVSWFKIIKPARKIRRSFFKMNIWALIANLFRYVFSSIDIILIGFYFGVTTTAIYTLTKSLANFLFLPASSFISSGLPSIGDLIGRKEVKTLTHIHSEQINAIVFAGFMVGIIIMLFNASFVSLWVNEKHFGGEALSRWIIIAAIIDTIAKTEESYIDASLKLKAQAISLGTAAIAYIVMIILLKPFLGLNVFPIAYSIAKILLIFIYWISIKECLNTQFSNVARIVIRPFLMAAMLFYAATFIQPFQVNTWLELIVYAAIVGMVTLIPAWILILQKNDRKRLTNRLLRLLGK